MLQYPGFRPMNTANATYEYLSEIYRPRWRSKFTKFRVVLQLGYNNLTNIDYYEFKKNFIAIAVFRYGLVTGAARFDGNHYR